MSHIIEADNSLGQEVFQVKGSLGGMLGRPCFLLITGVNPGFIIIFFNDTQKQTLDKPVAG